MKLHHGSKYNHTELKPGYERVGEKINWDETESNEYLYATISKEDAVGMSLASTVEQGYLLHQFQHHGNVIRIIVSEGPSPTIDDLIKLQTYVYTIRFDEKDGWEEVNNQHNNMKDEYKTKNTIRSSIEHVDVIRMEEWLKDKQIVILRQEELS